MKVLILGVTGAFGQSVAESLLLLGDEKISYPIVALVRDVEKAKKLFLAGPSKLHFILGDVQQKDTMSAHMIGLHNLDYIICGINYKYPDWDPLMFSAVENTIALAKETNATIIFPGNVYNLKPEFDVPLTEGHPCLPSTKQGRIRQKLEETLRSSSVKCINIRASDYFGPSLKNPNHQLLFEDPFRKGRSINWLGDLNGKREWVFLPDLANATTELMLKQYSTKQEGELYQVFHFRGLVVQGTEFVDTIKREIKNMTGKSVGCIRIPWWGLQLVGLWDSNVAEFCEMRYIKDNNIELSNQKLLSYLPNLKPLTPLDEAVRLTLLSFK